ncbi:MAG: hypothetical protein IJU61_14760 [Victivallales bacterium]|nr:hypothetical protein [Victivallales bacterium]
MKNWMGLLCVIGLLVGCQSGVQTTGGSTVSINGTRQTAMSPRQGAVPENVELQGSEKDLIRIRLESRGANAEAAGLAGKIAMAAKGGIAADTARVVEGAADLLLSVDVELEQKDVDGDYRRLDAVVRMMLKSLNGDRVFGTNVLPLKGVRKLGNAAVAQFEAPAAEAAAAWTRSHVQQIAQNDVAVAVVSFRLPRPVLSVVTIAERDAYNVKSIGERLAALKGVLGVECVAQSTPKRHCDYRIVYLRSMYPQGIVNDAALAVASIVQPK